MAIIQGSNTPIIVQIDNFEGADVISALLINQHGTHIKKWNKEDIDFNGNILTFNLYESETIKFEKGKHILEIKYIDIDTGIINFIEPLEICVRSRFDRTILGADQNV